MTTLKQGSLRRVRSPLLKSSLGGGLKLVQVYWKSNCRKAEITALRQWHSDRCLVSKSSGSGIPTGLFSNQAVNITVCRRTPSDLARLHRPTSPSIFRGGIPKQIGNNDKCGIQPTVPRGPRSSPLILRSRLSVISRTSPLCPPSHPSTTSPPDLARLAVFFSPSSLAPPIHCTRPLVVRLSGLLASHAR